MRQEQEEMRGGGKFCGKSKKIDESEVEGSNDNVSVGCGIYDRHRKNGEREEGRKVQDEHNN